MADTYDADDNPHIRLLVTDVEAEAHWEEHCGRTVDFVLAAGRPEDSTRYCAAWKHVKEYRLSRFRWPWP